MNYLNLDRHTQNEIENRLKKHMPIDIIPRYFKPIQFVNGYSLSIQMSYGLACYPSATFIDLNQYQTAEVAISYQDFGVVDGRGGALSEAINTCLDECINGTIYQNVPLSLVQEIFDYMAKNHKLTPKQFRI